jgi:hypothetical protein
VVEVAPLAMTGTSARCPEGKVALSAGVDFSAPGDASYGLEVLGAWPDGRDGTVRVRNANVFVRGSVRAYAICITDLPTRRQSDSTRTSAASSFSVNRVLLPCARGEGVAGGGTMGSEYYVLNSSAPTVMPQLPASHWEALFSGPVRLPNIKLQARVICLPIVQLAGWQIVESARVELGARGRTTLSTSCPSGSVPLSFGVLTTWKGNPHQDIVWNKLVPGTDGRVSASVQNRNLLALHGNLEVRLSTTCVRRA